MLPPEPLLFSESLIALAVFAIVFMGSVVQAGLGMGFGLMVAPVLALIDPALVPAAALYLGTITSIFGAAGERQSIAWDEVGIGMIGRTTGILAGTAVLLQIVDRSMFSLIFGCLILFAVGVTAFGWNMRLKASNLVGMGVISGFMGVITSVGAPPLALIYQSQDPKTARPTLAAFFAFGGALSLTSLYITGYAGLDDLWMALFMLPASLAGTWAGRLTRGRFDTRYRPALLVIAGVASVLLILRGLG
nr:putative sulfite exporter [uncultured bacterium]